MWNSSPNNSPCPWYGIDTMDASFVKQLFIRSKRITLDGDDDSNDDDDDDHHHHHDEEEEKEDHDHDDGHGSGLSK